VNSCEPPDHGGLCASGVCESPPHALLVRRRRITLSAFIPGCPFYYRKPPEIAPSIICKESKYVAMKLKAGKSEGVSVPKA